MNSCELVQLIMLPEPLPRTKSEHPPPLPERKTGTKPLASLTLLQQKNMLTQHIPTFFEKLPLFSLNKKNKKTHEKHNSSTHRDATLGHWQIATLHRDFHLGRMGSWSWSSGDFSLCNQEITIHYNHFKFSLRDFFSWFSGDFRGHYMTPTQTMHYDRGNPGPSTLPWHVALLDSPKIGNLMTPAFHINFGKFEFKFDKSCYWLIWLLLEVVIQYGFP